MSQSEEQPAAGGGQLLAVPDLAGTPTADAAGQFFGEVYGSLAEVGTGLIRYLDVDVHGAGRHVLVPIGHARVPRPGEPSACIRLRAANAEDLAGIPALGIEEGGDETEGEEALLAAFGRFFAGERYYAHPAFDHSGLYASERPLIGPATTAGASLVRLSELAGFETAEGEPDVRGWRLRTRDSVLPGVATDLIADPEALKVRYALIRLIDEREVLLPVGYLEVDADREFLRVPALLADDVRALPSQQGPVTRTDEEAVRAALDARLSGRRRFQRADFLARA